MLLNEKLGPILWNSLITLSASVVAITIPLQLVYNLTAIEDYLLILNWVVSAIFILDVVFNFIRCTRPAESVYFDEPKEIREYLTGWFIIDLLAALPFFLMPTVTILKLLPFLKLARVIEYMHQWRQRQIRYTNFLALFFFVYWLSLSSHWVSCGWLYIADVNLVNYKLDSYINALYWCISTITTVGYGDVVPVTNLQKVYAIFVEILGIGFYGYLIGNVVSLLTKKDPAKAHFHENLEKLSALVHFRKIPIELQGRIRDYYRYKWKKRLDYDEELFLKDLPSGLKNEVLSYLRKEVIEKISLFNEASPQFIEEIAMHLKPAVFTPGESIFKEGERGNEMYFVVRGELVVLSKDEKKLLSKLTTGDYFGEIALFMNKPRTATVKALSYCDLYLLKKKSFDYVLSKYPKFADVIEMKALSRNEIV